MEIYINWKMVSSDYMIRVETSLMDELNQNNDSLVEPHLYPQQCRMLGAVVPHVGCGSAALNRLNMQIQMLFHR